MSKNPSCPNCGKEVTAVSLDPDTPPWVCNPCARGWWNAELDPVAAKQWNPDDRSWGSPAASRKVQAACERERQDAWKKADH